MRYAALSVLFLLIRFTAFADFAARHDAEQDAARGRYFGAYLRANQRALYRTCVHLGGDCTMPESLKRLPLEEEEW